jgi:hypothetical protein
VLYPDGKTAPAPCVFVPLYFIFLYLFSRTSPQRHNNSKKGLKGDKADVMTDGKIIGHHTIHEIRFVSQCEADELPHGDWQEGWYVQKCRLNRDIHHPGATQNTGQSVDGTVIAPAWNGVLKGTSVALTSVNV